MSPSSVKDCVYRFVDIPPLCLLFLDTPPVQRMRRVKQLGVVQHVYPSATHTRFEHIMGAMFKIPQPQFRLEVLGREYVVEHDDPVRGFSRGERVVPQSYVVLHGMSSMIAHEMHLRTEDGRAMPVDIGVRGSSSSSPEDFYFVARDYPIYDACQYGSQVFEVQLEPTEHLSQIV